MTGEGRLVRDCMIEKIDRVQPYTRPVKDRDEWVELLRAKLLEEVAEVLGAYTDTEMIEELGDLLQVIECLAEAHDFTLGHVERAKDAKFDQKGGFGTVLAWRQPEEPDISKIELPPEDLRIETFRNLGAAGNMMPVNPANNVVKITHLPTGLSAVGEGEPTQMQNKAIAMRQLLLMLAERAEDE